MIRVTVDNQTGAPWHFHAGTPEAALVPPGASTFDDMPAAALAALQSYGNKTGTFIVSIVTIEPVEVA